MDEKMNAVPQSTQAQSTQAETPHPYEQDDALNDRLYNVSRKVDKILNRESVENHAAILGFIQVSGQRRAHEYEQRKAAAQAAERAAQMELAREAQRRSQFGVQ